MAFDPNSLVYVTAELKPAPGKAEELLTGMEELAGEVEKNEPGCLGYQYFYNEATEEVVVLEIYKDAASAEAHKNSAHFAEAIKIGMEGKLAAPPKIQIVKRKGGFRRG